MPIESVLLAWLDSTERMVMLVEAGFLLSMLLFFMSGGRMVKQKVLERRLARYLPESVGDAQPAASQLGTSATGEQDPAACARGTSADLSEHAGGVADYARPSAAASCSAARPAAPLGLQEEDALQAGTPSHAN